MTGARFDARTGRLEASRAQIEALLTLETRPPSRGSRRPAR